ncbi:MULTISPECIES: M23 family metallopeptidase [Asticcacaulis]|uniref:M23 family metallopeptidase n=1 Tax=Asticcacaulis TaxID=76890 RepID=UPI001AE56CEA|nr:MULTISPECIES: M23 family metallopeptidase [Asticcacaulis]MBP2159795.1 hypothetical protein [Asticcacaulis solisilvae]MDR6800840.1 hypothetical protein [Asticcacaulis sp. BE141]
MVLNLLGLLGLSLFPLPVKAAPGGMTFEQPIACKLGETCVIQQYFDHDPGTGVADYRCGAQTYDGHDGTDFRIPDHAALTRGVPVIAAADGFTVGVRDGEPDATGSGYDQAAVKDKECGNGVVIRHTNGWETQYCHMRKGSIRVKANAIVKAGTVLGFVGQSGMAAFPHLHFSLRHKGEKIDPFFSQAACSNGASLAGSKWRPHDQKALAYREAFVLNTGFTTAALEMGDIEKAGLPAPSSDAAAIIAYVRAIGLRAGDTQSLTVTDPAGAVMSDSALPALDRNKAQYLLYTGRKRPPGGWLKGQYSARYALKRQGRVIAEKVFTFTL